MIARETDAVGEAMESAVARVDVEATRQVYWEQDEFICLPEFLPGAFVRSTLVPVVERLKPKLNRNYIPGHKKGGSISSFLLAKEAPAFFTLYRSKTLVDFLSRLVNADLGLCPDHDPHSCALYYYTQPGDHIGFHYDTSYYKGARYTVLLGLVDRAPSCQLVCQLYKDHPSRAMKELSLATAPGTLIIFNGDKLWHAVTPLGPGEERVVLTLEYVTNPDMSPFNRVYSNLKDAFGYFGLKTLWRGFRRTGDVRRDV